jgi:orotate phosphoribosyltransferase
LIPFANNYDIFVMAVSYQKDALISIIREHALKFGQFTLASGKQASFYLDCRMVTLHPQGANQIAAGMLDVIVSNAFGSLPNAVGGLAIGADPITASVVVHAGLRDLPMLGFMVRKEAKQHGTGKLVEGPVTPGMKVVIVEDVITSGGSALKAAAAAKDYGLEVIGAVGVIDRLEGGRANFEAAGIPLVTLLTIDDFIPASQR